MLTTKEFANLCDTSKKTILYYHKIGLLKPAEFKGNNRLYEVRQVLQFQKIVLLKSFGYSLTEIQDVLKSENFEELFKNRQQKLLQQQEKLTQKLNLVKRYLENLKTKQLLINPKIKTVGPYKYYAIRRIGRYIDVARFDRELSNLIHDPNFNRVYFTIFHTDAYAPDKSDMTIAAIITEKNPKNFPNVEIQTIPSQKAAIYTHRGSYRYMSYVWQFLLKFVHDNNYCPNSSFPNRELYQYGGVEDDEDKLITQLQIPIDY